MEDFEKMLAELSKPEVKELKHQDLLGENIMRAKNRNALSFWWLIIPFYIIATLTMKTWYMKTTLKQEINLFEKDDPILSILLFLIFPAFIICFNAFFSSKRTLVNNVLVIFSSIVIFIYILTCYV